MRRFLFILLLAALVAFGYHRWSTLNTVGGGRRVAERFTPAAAPRIDLKDVQVLAAIDAEYSKLISATTPAVVCIRSKGVAPMDPFEMLFRRQAGAPAQVKQSLGSGVIVSKEGHVLTNAHVIEGMTEISVQLTDGRTVPAQLIGADKQTDIAVLRIEAPRIDPLPLGNSDEVRVGQMVFAIGNPFGLQETVTQGIISAKGRSISDSGVEFLQTDAAVNQGNSGGPLLNLRGEVIGINSAIYSETGGWLGISFAIPSNTARRTLESIIKTGHVVRPYLGVLMSDLTPELAQQFGVADATGALIQDVVPNSPAARAGLRPGDIVRSVNGRAIKGSASLRQHIAETDLGAKIELGFLRGGALQTTTAEIVEAPATLPRIQPQAAPAPPQSQRQLPSVPRGNVRPQNRTKSVLAGIIVGEIPGTLRGQLPSDAKGVAILQLDSQSAAAAKLQPGDVIEEINRVPVHSLSEFDAVAGLLPENEKALLYIDRGDSRLYIVLSPAN